MFQVRVPIVVELVDAHRIVRDHRDMPNEDAVSWAVPGDPKTVPSVLGCQGVQHFVGWVNEVHSFSGRSHHTRDMLIRVSRPGSVKLRVRVLQHYGDPLPWVLDSNDEVNPNGPAGPGESAARWCTGVEAENITRGEVV